MPCPSSHRSSHGALFGSLSQCLSWVSNVLVKIRLEVVQARLQVHYIGDCSHAEENPDDDEGLFEKTSAEVNILLSNPTK